MKLLGELLWDPRSVQQTTGQVMNSANSLLCGDHCSMLFGTPVAPAPWSESGPSKGALLLSKSLHQLKPRWSLALSGCHHWGHFKGYKASFPGGYVKWSMIKLHSIKLTLKKHGALWVLTHVCVMEPQLKYRIFPSPAKKSLVSFCSLSPPPLSPPDHWSDCFLPSAEPFPRYHWEPVFLDPFSLFQHWCYPAFSERLHHQLLWTLQSPCATYQGSFQAPRGSCYPVGSVNLHVFRVPSSPSSHFSHAGLCFSPVPTLMYIRKILRAFLPSVRLSWMLCLCS